MLIDTHAHLNFKAFKKDLPQVIDRTQKAGIEKIIIPGAKLDSSKKAVEIAQNYDGCFAAVGIHPHHAQIHLGGVRHSQTWLGRLTSRMVYPVRNSSEVKEALGEIICEEKVVAIGEIGLDYHQYQSYPPVSHENIKVQKELLLLQIDLAIKFNLPIIFHCRDAYDDLLDIISSYLTSGQELSGVFHCFAGEKNHLKKVLDFGFYVGFDGNITYPENQHLRNLITLTPVDKLLLETDSPFLTPMPFRGNRNEPSFLLYTASAVAELHNKTLFQMSEITYTNALKLFNL